MRPDDATLASVDKLKSVLNDEATFTLFAEPIDRYFAEVQERGIGGAPHDFPGWMYVVYAAAINVFGGQRRAARELPAFRPALATYLEARYPDDPERRWPAKDFTRDHWHHVRDACLVQDLPAGQETDLQRALVRSAVDTAFDVGLGDPAAGGTFREPVLERSAYSDGVAIRARSTAVPGELRLRGPRGAKHLYSARFDKDAMRLVSGDGSENHGSAAVFIGLRGPAKNRNHRLNLGVARVPKYREVTPELKLKNTLKSAASLLKLSYLAVRSRTGAVIKEVAVEAECRPDVTSSHPVFLEGEPVATIHYEGECEQYLIGELAQFVSALLQEERDAPVVLPAPVIDAEEDPEPEDEIHPGEAGAMVAAFGRVAAEFRRREAEAAAREGRREQPRLLAVLHDGALRGKHRQTIMTRDGVSVISHLHESARPATFVETQTIELPDGTLRQVDIWAEDGQFKLGQLNAEGNLVLHELTPVALDRHPQRGDRGYYWYGEYLRPPYLGEGMTLSIRGDGTKEDKLRGYNRPERASHTPTALPHVRHLLDQRNNAEGNNAHYKRSLEWKRAWSYGADRQLVDLIFYAHLTNCIARWCYGSRARETIPADRGETLQQVA